MSHPPNEFDSIGFYASLYRLEDELENKKLFETERLKGGLGIKNQQESELWKELYKECCTLRASLGEVGVHIKERSNIKERNTFDSAVRKIQEIGATSEDSTVRFYARAISRCANNCNPRGMKPEVGDLIELHIVVWHDDLDKVVNTVMTGSLVLYWGGDTRDSREGRSLGEAEGIERVLDRLYAATFHDPPSLHEMILLPESQDVGGPVVMAFVLSIDDKDLGMRAEMEILKGEAIEAEKKGEDVNGEIYNGLKALSNTGPDEHPYSLVSPSERRRLDVEKWGEWGG